MRDSKSKPGAGKALNPTDRSDRSDRFGQTDPSERTDKTAGQGTVGRLKKLRPSGGYRQLRSFQVATIIYDATVSFCNRFVDKRSRTHDQMVQAARSGRQNIAEGSRAGATSSKTETHLTSVARGSLDELLLDYEDFLRQRGLPQWSKDAPEAREVRAVGRRAYDRSERTDRSDPTDGKAYARWLAHQDPSIVANALICLIHQANYLLDQQIVALEQSFVENGGYREQLATARLAKRHLDQLDPSDPTDQSAPTDKKPLSCPLCNSLMVLRTARQGKNAGAQFWGCSGYPNCKGSYPLAD